MVVGSTAIVPIVELGIVVAPATVATVLMELVILAALEMVVLATLGLLLPLTIVLVVVVPLLVPAIGSLLSVLLGLHFDSWIESLLFESLLVEVFFIDYKGNRKSSFYT